MAYNKHTWVAPQGTNLNRFTKANETETSVELIQNPSLTNAPTPFSTEWMNEMEGGIEKANSYDVLFPKEVIALTEDDQEAALAALYGGTWRRVSSPAPRVLTAQRQSSNGSSSSPGGTGTLSVNISGAAQGSIVTIIVCFSGGTSATLISSTRGQIQTIFSSASLTGTFNSVVLQAGETFTIEVTGTVAIISAYWVGGSYNISRTEYLYIRE